MSSTSIGCLAAVLCVSAGFVADVSANDRLPKRLRPSYRNARTEMQKYMRFILRKVWTQRVRKLALQGLPKGQRRVEADAMVDEIVHLLLPQAKKLMSDVVFGTGATHLRIARPELRVAAQRAALEGIKRNRAARSLGEAIELRGRVAERELNDRLERALLADLEDYAQQWVEGAVGLPLAGRPRYRTRPLPPKWEKRYQKIARNEVHRNLYWWLRKRRRLSLTHLATAYKRPALDRARHQGPVWRLTSGLSHEAWAQNRLRIDYRWGRLNWEIDRRRIRRRMDQDLAQGAWALARMVKELLRPESVREATRKLERRVGEELAKPPLRQDADRYPESGNRLRKRLQRLTRELDPTFNRAMARVKLPADMPPDLQKITREHGRRFMREELQTHLSRAITRQATALAADRRVKERLESLVGDALRGFDPGAAEGRPERRRDFVKKEVLPKVEREVGEAMRAAGLDEFTLGRERHRRMVRRVMGRFRYDQQIEREAEKQLSQTQQ